MEQLALNFVPLKNQNFSIDVYRKIRKDDDPKNEDRAIFSLHLPIDQSVQGQGKSPENPYQQYWLSFAYKDGFELCRYSSQAEKALTIRYIFDSLVNHCRSILDEETHFRVLITRATKKIKFILTHHHEGDEVVWISPYYLDYKYQFGYMIDFKFDVKRTQTFNRRIQQLSLSLDNEYKSNRNLYFDKFEKIKEFAKNFYGSIFKNTIFDFGGFCQLPSTALNGKRYVFAANQEDSFPSTGLNKYGPFGKVDKPVIFYFLRFESEKDKAFKLYNALLGKEFPDNRFYKGLQQTYGLTIDQDNIKGLLAEKHQSSVAIEDAAQRLVDKHPNHQLVILAFSPRKEDEGNNKRRYLNIKYNFAQKQIPVQFVQYNTITNAYSLKAAIPNLALAIFAKLGGKPWKVKPITDDCLVVGISQTVHRRPEKRIKKYVAYSVLLDTGGIYKSLEVLSTEDEIGSHIDKLKERLFSVLKETDQKYKKIVLHVTYKLRRKELEAITQVLDRLDQNIELVVLRINTENDFWGFDQSKSHLTPLKNQYIPLSETKYLIWLDGLNNQSEEPTKRYSGPVYADFHYSNRELSRDDQHRYLQDLLNLSGANWRGLNAKAVPVSVYYCKLVSEYVKDFKEILDVDNLQSEFLNPWFL